MANSTIPNLVAVTVPALTDLFGVRQSGDTRDKKLTVTQLLTLVPSGGDVTKVGTPVDNQIGVWTGDGTIEGDSNFRWDGAHLLLPQLNDAATPTLAFGDGDSGFYESADDTIRVALGGVAMFNFDDALGGTFRSELGNGPAMRNVSSTSGTVASLVPRQGDSNTGIGNAGDDRLSMIAGGVQGIRIIEAASAISEIRNFGPTVIEGRLAFAASGSGALQNETASATNPTFNPNLTDEDTGIGWNAADALSLVAGGIEGMRISEGEGSIASLFAGRFEGFVTGSAAIRSVAASATVPTLNPSKTNLTTGIGAAASDQLSLIAGGQEMARLTEGVGVNQFAIKLSGASTVPDLTSLGDPDTGFRWTGANEIITVHANVRSWHFISGSFFADNSDGPIIFNQTGSATVPSICVERSDANTGLGAASSDTLSLIQGGVEGLRLRERNLGVIQAPQADLTITAFATGGQANATQLDSGSNVLGTVATTGDSVKLPPLFDINSVVFIKNDGAESANVFPATGDDLGGGLNAAVALASGASISFIATIASSTWTQWIISVAGGGGIAAVVDDPSPQLGGDLDTNGSNIVNADTTLPGISITAGTDPADEGGDLDLSSGDSGVGATGTGGAVNILAGESLATTGDGGVVSIKSGAGFFQGAGGDMLFEVGTGGAAGPGTSGNFFVNTLTGANAAAGLSVPIPGLVSIYGIGRSGEGPAGNLELWGGYASGTGAGSFGGDAIMWGGGQGGGSGEGGDAMIIGGESDTLPGDARVIGGVATTGGVGGGARITGGAGFGVNFAGGLVAVTGGLGIGLGLGGAVSVTGGNSGSGATGFGGPATLKGGDSLGTTGDGGDVTIQSGSLSGSGADGDININIGGTQVALVRSTTEFQFVVSPSAFLGSALLPALAFGDGDTGFYETFDDTFIITIGGVNRFTFADAANSFQGAVTGAGSLRNEVSSVTNPTLGPRNDDSDTGIGSGTADTLSIIAGGDEIARAVEAVGANQFIISPGVVQNAAATPSLAFGDGNTGFFESADNTLNVSTGNAARFFWQANNFFAVNSAGPFMFNAVPSSTFPTVGPGRNDVNTGLGREAADHMNLIAGGLSCMSVRTVTAARQIGFYVTAPIPLQTGVAVSSAGIHAALVALGLITA